MARGRKSLTPVVCPKLLDLMVKALPKSRNVVNRLPQEAEFTSHIHLSPLYDFCWRRAVIVRDDPCLSAHLLRLCNRKFCPSDCHESYISASESSAKLLPRFGCGITIAKAYPSVSAAAVTEERDRLKRSYRFSWYILESFVTRLSEEIHSRLGSWQRCFPDRSPQPDFLELGT